MNSAIAVGTCGTDTRLSNELDPASKRPCQGNDEAGPQAGVLVFELGASRTSRPSGNAADDLCTHGDERRLAVARLPFLDVLSLLEKWCHMPSVRSSSHQQARSQLKGLKAAGKRQLGQY